MNFFLIAFKIISWAFSLLKPFQKCITAKENWCQMCSSYDFEFWISSFQILTSDGDNGVLGFCKITLLGTPMKRSHSNVKDSIILPFWIFYSSKDSNFPGRGSILGHDAILPQPSFISGTKFLHILQYSIITEMWLISTSVSNELTES